MRAWWALQWRVRNAYWAVSDLPQRVPAWLAFQRNRRRYRVIDEAGLRAARKSDTVFIFGSGSSLNDLSSAEWRAIERHDTIGFNWFVHQQFVRCDFHMVREIGQDRGWRVEVKEYFDLIRSNPRFAHAIFLVQTGFRAVNGNRAIGLRLLPAANPVFLFRLKRGNLPSASLKEGLAHAQGTLSDCINFAALLGWKTIVLCGIDLYDRRYFWLPDGEPRFGDTTTEGPHNTAIGGIVDNLRSWREIYQRQGVDLFVYNKRSLLTDAMPVWQWPAGSLS